ncbi:NADH-ubiquinone oxidoreductase 20 kDa subunit [Neoasaia chiangmaiensis NBRC 101099]|uniref:Uncharacterized protein n=1 Tax=Neoasaia chiangmaiensis TaxID=320497 RepID=A0A1U9KSZ5_9PROT|nr:hypothetical protein [Neoasaia chiangmaiensis]AQS88862.1 hypothetical protein A0U93_14065 [Neoasaia chiangmaiensis]GBR40562.1 NADH-ubiquinone oxidoreductase 20 kDa subunit [Neoasaia chiangmaiensis NBRC 101099]GEN13840.1 hypothetical protein NCH01_02710 [Neoasaia chiangmaiensis]
MLRAFLDASAWRPRDDLPRAPRALTILHRQAGGCDGCAMEIAALRSGAYDLARHCIRFVETPHDAELLLVTGNVTRAMAPWLMAAWNAMPAPKGVVAVGDCPIDGGPLGETYATLGSIAALELQGFTRCDMTLRGCPPSPAEILRGLLLLAAGRVVSA